MAGRLSGVGVGPGDPELLTLKALKRIQECDVVAVPGETPRETTAYRIAWGAWPQIEQKELLGIFMPMTKDSDILEESHRTGAARIREQLNLGKKVVFLTLGDPTVYSTYLYLHQKLMEEGYETEIISGIPSFCAAAARLQTGIGEKGEQIHIIPASYQIEEAMKLPGTKILMKAGRKLPQVKRKLIEKGCRAVMVENCGMEGERIFWKLEEMPEDAGYYTLIIVKDEGELL